MIIFCLISVKILSKWKSILAVRTFAELLWVFCLIQSPMSHKYLASLSTLRSPPFCKEPELSSHWLCSNTHPRCFPTFHNKQSSLSVGYFELPCASLAYSFSNLAYQKYADLVWFLLSGFSICSLSAPSRRFEVTLTIRCFCSRFSWLFSGRTFWRFGTNFACFFRVPFPFR